MEIVKQGEPEKKYDFSISCQHCDCDFNCKITDTYPKTEWLFIFESKERLVKCPYCSRETDASQIRQFPVIVSKSPKKETKRPSKDKNSSLTSFAETVDAVLGGKNDPMWKSTTVSVSTPTKKAPKKKGDK